MQALHSVIHPEIVSDIRYWIALSQLADVGPVRARKLLSLFGSPERIFSDGPASLFASHGIDKRIAKSIKEFSAWDRIEQQIALMDRQGIRVISYTDQSYPEMLRAVEDAPVVLYQMGHVDTQDKFAIAIVGSRKPTDYGAAIAEKFSEDLASMGFTIVSGMARGIDSISHLGALKTGGRTIAVLGSGLDTPYPPENKTLMEKIARKGCAFSEFPPGTRPDRENFPRRNRLISGLSLGVLVIEATSDSGSLITTEFALEQGREVFAVPGNITSLNSYGTNTLIRRGAVLTRKAEDIVEELAPVLKGFIKLRDKAKIEITEEEKKLCDLLSGEPKQIDSISRESGWPTSKVLGILLGLELKGAVKQITGKRFYLA
jgi:DNA processing protein